MSGRPPQEIEEELRRLRAPLEDDAALPGELQPRRDHLLSEDPGFAERVNAGLAAIRNDDRRYAMALSSLRKAFGLTQEELAKRLGVSQANVSQLEGRRDMFVSTLNDYIESLGLHLRLVVEVPGRGHVDVALESLMDASGTAS